MQTRSSQNTQEDRTLEGRFLAQLYELAPFLDDMTYKAGCDTALDVRNLRKSDAPHKAKRKAMCLMKRLQAVVLAMVKAVKEKEARREAIAKERKEREALHAKYRLLIGEPSSHGGSSNANSSDLIYRARGPRRSGRGSF
jgi:hypothetical protein|mmetsp:Transcript_14719/g.38036  ORF Transcript_14719/g.38036 Transcript_14719/m.38036 type:complete len:140 (+) Transcript_14719:28-447(+)